MKRHLLFKSLLLLCALVVGSTSVWATDGTLTLSSSNKFGTSSGSTKDDDQGNTWTCVGDNIQNTYSSDYSGQQFGTGSTNKVFTFTANFSGKTVTGVSITAAAGNTTPTYDISVGGVSKKSGSLSKTSTTYSTGTISGTGNVVITLDQNNGGKAVYLGKIVVTYSVITDNPSISVTPTTRTVNYDVEDGTLSVTLNKIDTDLGTDIEYYESDGTTSATYSWFAASINGDGNVEYVLEENTDPDNTRTAYFKVFGYDEESGDEVYSDLVSITQGKYAVDFATLPFSFDGGKGDLPTGMTHTGLGSNYDSSPKLRFDDQGDNLILKVKGTLPKELSFDIKGNSMSGTYAFKVQWSANGTDYTDLATYTSISSKATKTIDISSCTGLKYIKWVYATKKSGNVALGNIKVTPQTDDVLITSTSGFATLYTAKPLDFSSLSSELKAYTATVEGSTVTLAEVENIPANTGVVLKGNVKTHKVPIATSSSTAKGDLTGNTTEATAYNAFTGYDLYMLALNGEGKAQFTLVNDGSIAAGKAFLKLAHADARELNVVFADDEATGVADVRCKMADGRNDFYNLNGQKVLNPTKGLYIVNGKKVVIK